MVEFSNAVWCKGSLVLAVEYPAHRHGHGGSSGLIGGSRAGFTSGGQERNPSSNSGNDSSSNTNVPNPMQETRALLSAPWGAGRRRGRVERKRTAPAKTTTYASSVHTHASPPFCCPQKWPSTMPSNSLSVRGRSCSGGLTRTAGRGAAVSVCGVWYVTGTPPATSGRLSARRIAGPPGSDSPDRSRELPSG